VRGSFRVGKAAKDRDTSLAMLKSVWQVEIGLAWLPRDATAGRGSRDFGQLMAVRVPKPMPVKGLQPEFQLAKCGGDLAS